MDYLQAVEQELDFWTNLKVDSNTENINYLYCFCDYFIQNGFFERGIYFKKRRTFEAVRKPFCHMCFMKRIVGGIVYLLLLLC